MKETIVEQFDLLELQLRVARLFLIEAQMKSLTKPCSMEPNVCLLCKAKRKILRERNALSQ